MLAAAVVTFLECGVCGEPPDSAGSVPPDRPKTLQILSFISPLLIPKLIGDGATMKDYVRSPEFAALKARVGDRRSVDFLFRRSLKVAWDNTAEGLLLMFVATMDHRAFGLKAPLIGNAVWVPLTSEFESDFRARVTALPRGLYPDTPPGISGDRDKLQHFFGSAFLTYVTESDAAAARVGNFIEWGEDLFIVGGVNDPRDARANAEGRRFAFALMSDPDALPSGFFGSVPTEMHPPAQTVQDSVRVHPEAE
jgi:hypothetical protein